MKKRSRNVAAPNPEKRGRGRPSLGDTEMLMVRVPGGTLARIDQIAGAGKRAEFVRGAIEREITRRSRSHAARPRRWPVSTATR
jgi:hypothetical protein